MDRRRNGWTEKRKGGQGRGEVREGRTDIDGVADKRI